MRLNKIYKKDLIRIVENAVEDAWQNEIIDTGMLSSIGENEEYISKEDWIDSKINEWSICNEKV